MLLLFVVFNVYSEEEQKSRKKIWNSQGEREFWAGCGRMNRNSSPGQEWEGIIGKEDMEILINRKDYYYYYMIIHLILLVQNITLTYTKITSIQIWFGGPFLLWVMCHLVPLLIYIVFIGRIFCSNHYAKH